MSKPRLDSLLGGLLEILLRLVQLLFEQLDFSRQVLARGPVGVPFVRCGLQVLDLSFGLLQVALGQREFVLEGRDLLISFEECLVELRMGQ